MNTQTITLTPPIDGVQYGYSNEHLKGGDWACRNTEPFILHIKEGWNNSLDLQYRKIVICNNPKDTRFPFLQMACPTCGKREFGVCSNSWHKNILPSKEQEIKVGDTVLWHMEKNHTLLTSNHKSRFVEVKAINEKGVWLGGGWVDFKDIEQLPTNPAKYTQEQMEKAMFEVYKNGIRNPKDGKENFTEVSNRVFQSLQPTAKAVRVEMEENQCDGCKGGIPVDENNYHRMGKGIYVDYMYCQKHKYNKIKLETSSEHPQGIVRAIKVIY